MANILLGISQVKSCHKNTTTTLLNLSHVLKVMSSNFDKGSPDMNNMDKDDFQRQIELLQVLAEGCRKHPAYRARRAATERCPECMVVWKARCELNELSATHR